MGQAVGSSVMGGAKQPVGFAPTTGPMQNLMSILGPVMGSAGGLIGGKAGGLMGVLGPLAALLALRSGRAPGRQNPMIKF